MRSDFLRVYREVFDGGDPTCAAEFFAPDYREHNRWIGDGLAASLAHQRSVGGYACRVRHLVEDGVWVLAHAHYRLSGRFFEVVDVYRRAHGLVVEHWDVVVDRDGATIDWSSDFLDPVPVGAPVDTERSRSVAAGLTAEPWLVVAQGGLAMVLSTEEGPRRRVDVVEVCGDGQSPQQRTTVTQRGVWHQG